jgi:hypothetical protein
MWQIAYPGSKPPYLVELPEDYDYRGHVWKYEPVTVQTLNVALKECKLWEENGWTCGDDIRQRLDEMTCSMVISHENYRGQTLIGHLSG